MGAINVKNTIVERVLQNIAPHPCSGCGKIGTVLCDYCKYDIRHEPFLGCIVCELPSLVGICENHGSPMRRVFVVGARGDALETLINRFKFHNVKAAAFALGELLDARLPYLPDGVVLVPIPTVRSHIRQRGYDQVGLLAGVLAKRRRLPVLTALVRKNTTTQHTVGRRQRLAQAETAFGLAPRVDVKGKTVLLLDDVITTGATVTAAARLLRDAGATVWVASLAYQPSDALEK